MGGILDIFSSKKEPQPNLLDTIVLAEQTLPQRTGIINTEYFLFIDAGGTKVEFEPYKRVSFKENGKTVSECFPVQFSLSNHQNNLVSVVSNHIGNILSLNDKQIKDLGSTTSDFAAKIFPDVTPSEIKIVFAMAGAADIKSAHEDFSDLRRKGELLKDSLVVSGFNRENITINGDAVNLVSSFSSYVESISRDYAKFGFTGAPVDRAAVLDGPVSFAVLIAGTGSVAVATHFPRGINNPSNEFFYNGGHGPVLGDKGSATFIGHAGVLAAIERGDSRVAQPTKLVEKFFENYLPLLPKYRSTNSNDLLNEDLAEIKKLLKSGGDLHSNLSRFHGLFSGRMTVEITKLHGHFAKDVIECALYENDHTAKEILVESAYELAKYVLGAVEKGAHLGDPDSWRNHHLVVGYHGGVFKNPDARRFIVERMLNGDPDFRIDFPGITNRFKNVTLIPFGVGEGIFELAPHSINANFPSRDEKNIEKLS